MAPADNQPAVMVEGAKQRHWSVEALDGVSFKVPAGAVPLRKPTLDVFVSLTGQPAEERAQLSGRALV